MFTGAIHEEIKLLPRPALTQGGYELTRSRVSGGGAIASGGDYQLSTTIGQADAGEASGGDYTLGGGFWSGGEAGSGQGKAKVYLPLILR